MIESLQDALTTPVQAWLKQHWLLDWLISHPLWLLASVMLALFLFSGLLRAMAGLTERFWLALLRLPVLLGRWVWLGSSLLFRPLFFPLSKAEQPVPSRLAEVLARLEALRQEEHELIQEMKSLLSSQARSGQDL